MAEIFLPLKAVLARSSLSRRTIYRLIAEGTFPKPIQLGSRSAFLETEFVAWQEARIAERAA